MKKQVNRLLILTLACMSLACDPDKAPVIQPPGGSDGPPAPTGAVTPVGGPDGPALTATIGPAGGTLQSSDHRIKLVIPAGALSENKTISVQPIGNHCPAGTGPAFRLTPHGLTFAKPITLTLHYDSQDLRGSAPEMLRIAYQNDKGIWRAPVVKSLDTTAHTVAVQTTHFSDWGLFQRMFINPQSAILDPGGKVHLSVYQVEEPSTLPDHELVIPLPVPIDHKYIDRWQLMGEGTLTHQQSSGDYQAPARIPTKNPAAITVFLNVTVTIEGKVFKDIRLVSNVYVAPEGLSVLVNGGWLTFPGGANINTTENVILGRNGADFASIGWVGAPTGTFHWTKGTDVAFNLRSGTYTYQHLYGKGLSVSGGSLTVDNSDKTWTMGTFTVQPAGWINTGTQPLTIGASNIQGVFRMKRVSQ